jgi:hypothetical protein
VNAWFGPWLFVVSVCASALGGMLGMAGGIFIVPVLTLFGHIDKAIGASIVSVIASSCGCAAPFLKSGLANIRLAMVLETATTLGALTGVLLAGVPRGVSVFSFRRCFAGLGQANDGPAPRIGRKPNRRDQQGLG